MRRFLFTAGALVTMSASQAEPAFGGLIPACIDQLVLNDASLLVHGKLSDRWSRGEILFYEKSGIALVMISRSERVNEQDHSLIDERPTITCTLDGNGKVVSLRAPPSDDSRAELQLIANGASAEDEMYRKLQDSFGNQSSVLRTDLTFRRFGEEFKMVGKPEDVQVKRSEFAEE